MTHAAVLCLFAAGCGPGATFTARGAACPSQPEDCEVTVITSRPDREFQVVGVLDIEAFAVRSIPDDEASFLTLVRPEVCRAGGDAVIPGVTGDGRYIQATVVKWVEEGATEPACLPDAGVPDVAGVEGEAAPPEAPGESTSPTADEPPAAPEAPARPPEAPTDEPALAPEGAAFPAGACRGGAPC